MEGGGDRALAGVDVEKAGMEDRGRWTIFFLLVEIERYSSAALWSMRCYDTDILDDLNLKPYHFDANTRLRSEHSLIALFISDTI